MPDRPTQAQIYQSAVDFKDALIARDQKASERIVKTYARAFNRMRGNIDALVKRIEQARAAGQYVSPAWAFQLDRYLTLQRQINEEIGRISREVESITIKQQAAAVSQSVSDASKLATMAAENAGVSVSFATLPKSATESIAGFLADGSPLSKLTSRLPGQAAAAIADALTDGITMGWGAEKTARRMRDALGGNMNRALNIARTETMRAYREANYRTINQNRDILQGWVWVASFSRRTCASCIAMAGTVHPMEERMESHPRCRCSQAPLLRGQAVEFQKGEEWFAEQPEEIQRAILGSNIATQSYRDGKVTLTDFVGRQNSPEWGKPYYQISTKRALLKQGQFPGYNHPADVFSVDDLLGVKDLPLSIDSITTIKQAEEWSVRNGIAKSVDYSKLQLKDAIAVNRELGKIWREWKLDPLTSIDGGLTGAANAEAHGRMIRYHSKLGDQYSIEDSFFTAVTDFQETQKDNLRMLRFKDNAYKKTIKYQIAERDLMDSVNYSRWIAHTSVETYVAETFIHEAGHVIGDQLFGMVNKSMIKDPSQLLPKSQGKKFSHDWAVIFMKRGDDRYKISQYADTNQYEFFAECFVMYNKEKHNLPRHIVRYFDKLKKYANK